MKVTVSDMLQLVRFQHNSNRRHPGKLKHVAHWKARVLSIALVLSVLPFAHWMAPEQNTLANQKAGPSEWRAKWIWQASSPWLLFDSKTQTLQFKEILPSEKNLHVYLRKTFDLASQPRSAPAYVTADSRYRLYVNGQFVGRGPARSYPRFQYYDVYDLAKYLKPGKNVVAAVVHYYGEATAFYLPGKAGVLSVGNGPKAMPGKGGFLFQCDVESANEKITVKSDETWKVQLAQAWKQDMPRINFSLGFIEVFDARKDPLEWNKHDFDDSEWTNAIPYASWSDGVAPVEPFGNMLARDIPPLLEKQMPAEKIIEAGEVSSTAGENPADLMMNEEIVPISQASIQNADALLKADGQYATILAPEGKSVSLVLDFGRTVTGYSRLDIDAQAGAIVDIGVSERLSRNKERYYHGVGERSGMPARQTGILFNTEHGKQVDRYIARDGKQTWETGDIKGFRYVQVTFRNIVKPLKVDAISMNFTSYPVENRGSFECSNPLLNRIWKTGAYTLQMCMSDAYVDCPSREQRQWVGDAYVEAMINYAAFGDPRLTAKLLRQTAQSQQSDGMTMMYAPGDHDVLATTIVDYSLSWILTAYEYYRYTGDSSLIKEIYPHLRLAVGWFERHLDEHGMLGRVPGWVFIDWANVDKRGEITALNALLYKALKDAAQLAKLSGVSIDATHFDELAATLKKSLNDRMWDSKRGVYVDCYVEGGPCRRVSQQSNAAMILFEIAPQERWQPIISYISDPKRTRVRQTVLNGEVISGGTFDEETDVVMAQPFFSYFVHRALAKVGATDKLMSRIEERWGAMLDAGATTWWEEWVQRPSSSECHAWSASPTFDLSTEVLGVQPIAPGFASFRVAPRTAGLTFAKGVFPTVKGDIQVDWTIDKHVFSLNVLVPAETTAEVVLPVAKASRVRANNTLVWSGAVLQRNAVGVAAATWDGQSLKLKLTRSGQFKFTAEPM